MPRGPITPAWTPRHHVRADFLLFKNHNFKIDLTFLSPEVQHGNIKDLLSGVSPPLIPAIRKALKNTSNLIISLPKKSDLSSIPEIYFDGLQETVNSSFSIEIELIYLNDKPNSYLIHYGATSKVKYRVLECPLHKSPSPLINRPL